MSRLASVTRALRRLVAFGVACAGARLDWAVRRWGGGGTRRDRAEWQVRHARRMARILGLEVSLEGPVLAGVDLIVSNHLSYLDVVALASVRRCTFVSKSEVRRWPLIGGLLEAAGTILVDRSRRTDVGRVGMAMASALAPGVPLVLFPEGTTGDGRTVGPFRSALLGPAADAGWRVLPVGIRYELPDGGRVERDVCFCGTAAFVPHFFRLLGHARIRVHLRFGRVVRSDPDRKTLAARLHAEVVSLSGAGPGREGRRSAARGKR